MNLKEENSDFVYLGKRIDKALNYIQHNELGLVDWFKQYVEIPYQDIVFGELDLEEEDYIFSYLDSLLDDMEEKFNIIFENKMDKETLRMQMLAGVITESEYAAAINQEVEETEKDSLNEHFVAGGIVGIGAINQIPSRAKADYEDAFEYFLSQKYTLNEAEGDVMVDSMALASYIDELVSLADDMEYTPDMIKELQDLKAGLPGGKMSVENALDVIKQTIDITEDDIDPIEALGQAVDYDDAIVAKAREIAGLGEGKEVDEPTNC